jgi:hypothetical protein
VQTNAHAAVVLGVILLGLHASLLLLLALPLQVGCV